MRTIDTVQDYAKAEMPADEFFLDYDIETCEGQYSPVSTGSIAGAMLRNLGYAKDEARLDNLQIQDALDRDKVAKNFHNSPVKSG